MIQPIRDRVLIKPFPPDEISSGGIYIADSYAERNNKATIIAVGNGVAKRPMRFEVDQVIHHVKDAGEPIIENGELFYIIGDVDILSIVN